MAYSVARLPARHREFAERVCRELHRNHDKAIREVIADGSLSPNGERYVAVRLWCSWRVTFDFNEGRTFEVNIQLPDEAALGEWG